MYKTGSNKRQYGMRIKNLADIGDYLNPDPSVVQEAPPPKASQKYLNGKVLKVTIPLDPLELCGYTCTDTPRITLQIRVGERKLTADITNKSLRKAHDLIREVGPEGCFAHLQGKLVGEEIVEVGLVAQAKVK